MDDKKKVLVTGGAGFIGSHLVEQLVADGNSVTVSDNLSTGFFANLKSVWHAIEFRSADLLDLLQRHKIDFGYYDIVYHLAANAYVPPSVDKPELDFRANLLTTFYILEEMRKCDAPPKLINVSSAAVYGNPAKFPISEADPTVPIAPYGVSKLAAERYVSVFCQLYDLPGASVRLFSVYGPRQRKQVVYDFFHSLRENQKELRVFGNGSQIRDFNYVDDVVSALTLVAREAPARGEVYNVSSGKSISISELATACINSAKLSAQIVYTGDVRQGDAEKWVADLTRIKNLGYTPVIDLDIGLAATQKWYWGLS